MDGINIGQVLTIIVTLAGMAGMAIGFIWAIKANTLVLDARLTAQTERMSETVRQMEGMQKDLKQLNDVVTKLALQDQRTTSIESRVDAHGRRMDALGKQFEELRHGEGFVFPLTTIRPTP